MKLPLTMHRHEGAVANSNEEGWKTVDADGEEIASNYRFYPPAVAPEDQREIVRACNAFSELVKALRVFARVADMEHRAKDGDSVIINVSRLRDARALLARLEGL